jgi:hypothetical protein
MPWAGVIGAGPLQVGTRRRLWRHHDGPQQSRSPHQVAGLLPPPQPPRLGALLPLPSCLLPVRSHGRITLWPLGAGEQRGLGSRYPRHCPTWISKLVHVVQAEATGVTRTDPASDYFTTSRPLLHATPWTRCSIGTAKQRPAVRPLASQWPPSAVCMGRCTALVPHALTSRRRQPPIGQQFMAIPSYHRPRQRASIASPHASR